MNLPQFSNALRVLWNIDAAEYLACINATDRGFFEGRRLWETFRDNPHRTFLALPTQDQERVFAIIEQRNKDAGL